MENPIKVTDSRGGKASSAWDRMKQSEGKINNVSRGKASKRTMRS